MDDRWIAIWDDGVLRIIRSWTSICCFRLVLGEGDVHELQIDPVFAEKMDPEELREFAFSATDAVIDMILEKVPIPINMIPSGVVGNILPCPPDYGFDSRMYKEFEIIVASGQSGCFHLVS